MRDAIFSAALRDTLINFNAMFPIRIMHITFFIWSVGNARFDTAETAGIGCKDSTDFISPRYKIQRPDKSLQNFCTDF